MFIAKGRQALDREALHTHHGCRCSDAGLEIVVRVRAYEVEDARIIDGIAGVVVVAADI